MKEDRWINMANVKDRDKERVERERDRERERENGNKKGGKRWRETGVKLVTQLKHLN